MLYPVDPNLKNIFIYPYYIDIPILDGLILY